MTAPRTTLFRADNRPHGGEDGSHQALSLIVRLRLVHVVFELALLYPALRYGWMNGADVPWYLGALGGLLVFNLITGLWRRQGFGVSPAFLLLQVAVDLTAMTILFSVSGGLTNPVHSLIHFQIGLAGIVLSPPLALSALALGFGSLTLLGWGTQSLGNAYAWVGPLGPNLAYEWALAAAVCGLSIFAARLNKHYRDRLRVAEERIRQQDRLRAAGAVASGFCHELASPLNAAGLLTNRLRRKTAPGQSPIDLSEEWDELTDSLTRCDQIVRSMAGTPWDPEDLGLQITDAGYLLAKITREWTGRIPVRLNVEAQHVYVAAPAVGLAQILMTLLRNAEEASTTDSQIEVCMTTAAMDGKEMLLITVSDRGGGVEPGVLRAFGEPFNSSKGAGRGLGLFAALHLTESLGGSLTLSPRAGGGTRAALSLPVAASPGLTDENEDTEPETKSEGKA